MLKALGVDISHWEKFKTNHDSDSSVSKSAHPRWLVTFNPRNQQKEEEMNFQKLFLELQMYAMKCLY